MEALLTREALAGLAGNGPEEGSWAGGDAGRLEGEVGYGQAVHGGGFIGTPNIGIGLSDGGVRDWRIGWRLTTEEPGDADIEVRLDAIWSEAASSDEGSKTAFSCRARSAGSRAHPDAPPAAP